MKSTCKTSVIIPVYNTEDYLAECLDSVLAQTQRDIEVILVDDGSTDSSPEIERRYAERDPRVRVIMQENQRQGAARNRGLEQARGKYVYFMDSDDLIIPTHLETCFQACEDDSLDFVTFDTVGFEDDPDVERPELFHEVSDRRGIVTSEIVDGVTFWHSYLPIGMLPFICWMEYCRRDFLIDNDLRFVEGIFFEDNDWVLRVYLAARRIKYLPLRLHRYRHRPGSNVHAGFTHVLAESCFDVHDILCGLARAEHDSRRLEMIYQASYIKDFRFQQFSKLEPTDDLRMKAAAFAERVERELADADLPEMVRSMHLNALLRLSEGVFDWPDPPLASDEESLARMVCSAMPSAELAPRVGIYGTGSACTALLKGFDANARTCFFLESEVSPGRMYRGEQVYSIDAAASLDLDAVIITSKKYAEEMKANVVRCLGEDMPVYVVPESIFILLDKKLIFKLKHPTLRRARRKLRNLKHALSRT